MWASSARVTAALVGAGLVLATSPPAAAGPVSVLFRIADPRVVEASGIAVGHASPGIVYVHNDSGDTARVFAIDRRSGRTAAVIRVRGAENRDWEDMAVAPSSGGHASLWLADIGDNEGTRSEVRVYRVDEPRISPNDRRRVVRTERADEWRLRYPVGPIDAESLAVTPDGAAYIVTKSLFGATQVYRVPANPDRQKVQTLRRVGSIVLRPSGGGGPLTQVAALTVTSAALSPDGSLLVVRTYRDAYVWPVVGNDVAEALTHAPARVRLPDEKQGEGVTVDGDRLLLDSEGDNQPVLSVPLPSLPTPGATVAAPSGPAAGPASGSVRPAISTSTRASTASWSGGRTALVGGVGLAVLVAAGGGVLVISRRRRHPNRT